MSELAGVWTAEDADATVTIMDMNVPGELMYRTRLMGKFVGGLLKLDEDAWWQAEMIPTQASEGDSEDEDDDFFVGGDEDLPVLGSNEDFPDCDGDLTNYGQRSRHEAADAKKVLPLGWMRMRLEGVAKTSDLIVEVMTIDPARPDNDWSSAAEARFHREKPPHDTVKTVHVAAAKGAAEPEPNPEQALLEGMWFKEGGRFFIASMGGCGLLYREAVDSGRYLGGELKAPGDAERWWTAELFYTNPEDEHEDLVDEDLNYAGLGDEALRPVDPLRFGSARFRPKKGSGGDELLELQLRRGEASGEWASVEVSLARRAPV